MILFDLGAENPVLLTKQMGIKTKDAFAAIYMAFIGKTHGPRAGMLLAKFGKEKVSGRISAILEMR